MNVNEIQIWPLLAGLGLFLFGMFMLEEALKSLAGRSFKKFLRNHTNTPVKAIISGTMITAIMQSSTMVTLLVMSFAGAGIIGLKNGIGMILGASLGTTITGWLVSLIGFKLNIGNAILPFLAIGGFGILFFKSEKLSSISKIIMGFGIMFLGLNYMKEGFEEFAEHFNFSYFKGKSPLLFLLAGFILTATIQSSSASMLIFLSSLSIGMITLHQGAYLVIGAGLGTTVTTIISTFKANSIKRKVGWSQVCFNVFIGLIALILMQWYLDIIKNFIKVNDPLIALVLFHTILNLVGIVFIFPFLNYFTSFIDKFITSKEVNMAQKIMLVNPDDSHVAIEALQNEASVFLQNSLVINHQFLNLSYDPASSIQINEYDDLKKYENEIVDFYIRLQQTNLSVEEVSQINASIASIRNATLSAKDLKDIKHNLNELSGSAQDDLFELYKMVRENQKLFYDEIKNVMNRKKQISSEDISKLMELQKSIYQNESEEIYKLFSIKKHHNFVIPNVLNMIRKINNSNEAILRAVNHVFANGNMPPDNIPPESIN